ncbi:putative Polycomb group protein ASXL3 [Ostrinia nubilalis]|uniref:putative Polycomb group protein ASXL3 n=1 Tax=Ostrinia nubilalis TaxID=29057 RepID=UPI003082404F
MELDVSPETTAGNDMDYSDTSSDSKYLSCNNNEQSYSVIRIPDDTEKTSKHSSKKQSKRRKKSSSHSRPLPRIIVKPLPPPPPPETREWTAASSYSESSCSSKPSTMREVLASIPGFCMKPRKRSGKKLSTAAQLQQTREGCIDLETPDSILVNTNIRALLNKHTFSLLPPLYQYKLGQLLPSVDRLSPSGRLNSSSLSNEFFARACLEWQDSLSGGEFTPENQQKMKTEAEKEKSKIDPWKLKHFEPFWGEKSKKERSAVSMNSERPSLKTTIKLRPTASITSSSTVPKIKKSKSGTSKRMRSVGAVTRSSSKADDVQDEPACVASKSSAPLPDLLPIKHIKGHNQGYVECQVDFSFSDSSSVQQLEDSTSSTPVDPLLDPLLPDNDPDRNELKNELDMNVVTIEESSVSKVSEEVKANENAITETTKRSNNCNDEYVNLSKRIKFEVEYEMDNSSFMPNNVEGTESNTCSDTENNYNTEPLCSNDELHIFPSQDQGENSEDGKATTPLFNYDDGSISSVLSPKTENQSNDGATKEPNSNADLFSNILTTVNAVESLRDDIEIKDSPVSQDLNLKECADSMPSDSNLSAAHLESPTENNSTVLIEQEIEQKIEVIQEIECQLPQVDQQESIKSEDLDIQVKCEDRTMDNVQSYYDEHFKDAESFILETGGLSILTSQSDDIKFPPHPNLMELSSYMSETNVTAVVTMPLTHNSSIPMMEVTNTSIVSYPDDSMQDPAKPKTSAVTWKTDNDWTNNENIVTLHSFSNVNNENTKYVSEDSKTSLDDVNMNDENCMYKEDRDANYNMESSSSSESCQSMKEMSIKLENDTIPSLVSGTTATNLPVNSTSNTITQSARPMGKKSKLGKESNRSRSSNKVPPGAVNLERSYQICQAVIQNSPNRDALRGQLRPPPALLTRPSRAPRPPPPPLPLPPPPMLVRQLPVPVMAHNEINENRPNNVGQYILVQRTPNVAPRASSAPPSNQNSNVSVARCRSVGAEDACVCNLRAMILCKKCGAFCHDDCIGSAELCLTCLIR